MTPDDVHALVQALIQLLSAAAGYFASHYGNQQGAMIARAPAPPAPKPVP